MTVAIWVCKKDNDPYKDKAIGPRCIEVIQDARGISTDIRVFHKILQPT